MTDDRSDGIVLDGYERLSLVGIGGSAAVYSARRIDDGETVAIKVFDATAASAFDRQLAAATALRGIDGLLPIETHGTLRDGRSYIVSPFAHGGSLADHLTRFGALPARRVAELGAPIARALAAAHAAGVVHRDVKPSNVLLTRDDTPLVADFGAATSPDIATGSETMAVTVMYSAPEVLEGAAASPASDQYSLALSLIALAHGHHPLSGHGDPSLVSLVNRICAGGIPDPATMGLPAGLAAVLGRATSIAPSDRYPSTDAFADALDRVALDPTTVPTGAGRRAPATRTRRRIGALAVLAVLAVVGVVVGVAIVIGGSGSDDDTGTQPNAQALTQFGAPVTARNGIMGPLYRQDDITYVGMLDRPCASGQRLAELSTHAGPADFARGVTTPWEAVTGDGVGVFMAWMPCDTKIHEARFKLGATGRWFVYVAEFPEEQYETMVAAMRANETSPSPDYTVNEDVLRTLENPNVYKGWAVIDRPA